MKLIMVIRNINWQKTGKRVFANQEEGENVMKKKNFFQVAPLLIVLALCFGGLPEGHAVPIFGDVPPTYWSYVPIETLSGSGITQGCSAVPPLYCPESQVLRSQMAVFLVRTFNLP